MRRLLQVFEHERLTRRPDALGRFLSEVELARLYDFNDRHDNKYFTGIRDGVKFKSYVGVIQIGGLTIEVLPKSDRNKGEKSEYSVWHSVLLDMLRICKKINVHTVSETNLRKRHQSILELYFEMYLDEVEVLLRQGLIKKYRRKAGNTPSLKGQILFAQQIQQNLIHQERFFTKHQVYDHENVVNQILMEGLHAISELTQSPSLNQRIAQLTALFPPMRRKEIQPRHFQGLGDDRALSRYQKALNIAKMILLNYSPDIQSGRENMLALMFDMNVLWEEYVYRMLLRVKIPGLVVKAQNGKPFWVNTTLDRSRSIRPDLVIYMPTAEGLETFVVDTKWKVLDAKFPRPSDDDLKQMFVYNAYWKSNRSMLLYPTSNPRDEALGRFWHQFAMDEVNECRLGFVSVLDAENKLNLSIGDSILEKLNSLDLPQSEGVGS